MCSDASLAWWLGEIPKEQAWMDRAVITKLAFNFERGGCTMMVKRTHEKHGKQICWIECENPRRCMQYLYGSFSTTRGYVAWKEDTYGA